LIDDLAEALRLAGASQTPILAAKIATRSLRFAPIFRLKSDSPDADENFVIRIRSNSAQ
jgi:hypothetical protein